MGLLGVLAVGGPAAGQPTMSDSVLCRMGAPAGASRYRPGAWSLVEVYAINQTDEPAEAQAVLRFSDDPTLQYGRRVFVPPHSNLRTTCPVFVPQVTSSNFRVDFVAEQVEPLLVKSSRSQRDAVLAPQSRLLNNEAITVGMISDLTTPIPSEELPYFTDSVDDPPIPDQAVYDLVLAAKRARRLSRKISELNPVDMPADPAGLDVLDVIVLSSDDLTSDLSGITILRDWVLAGGRLWILLDQVTTDTVAAVMGDAFTTTVVDRVELTTATIKSVRPDLRYRRSGQIEFRQPVEMVRVLPQNVTVTDTIDDWPAAFWQPFGAGSVYFTTTGPAAWMRPTTGRDPPPITEDDVTPYFPREPLRYFAAECLSPKQAPELTSASLQPFLAEQIGYRILSRQAVGTILTLFCSLFAVACLVLLRWRRPEHLLWVAPLAVAVTSAVFVVIATSTKRSVPPTAATIARVVLEPGLGTGHTYGLAAVYNRDASNQKLAATRGGVFFPDMTALAGRRRLVTWTDEGSWHWEALELPAGVRTAPFKYPITLPETIDCRAHFAADGLVGSLGPLPFADLEDAIISIPYQPAMAVTMGENGTFQSAAADVLPPNTYIGGTFVNDEQRRRMSVYERVFSRPPRPDVLASPTFFAWGGASDLGVVFPQSQQLGSSLLSVPVRLERSSPGTKVKIPAPFLPYRAVNDQQGRRPTVYGNLMREWVETKQTAYDWLRFQLPPVVLPLQVERARLTINVRAPSRTVEIVALAGRRPTVVTTLSHPIGTFSAVIDQAELLQLDEQGGLQLAIRVGEDEATHSPDPMQHASWKVTTVQLEVDGTVQGDERT